MKEYEENVVSPMSILKIFFRRKSMIIIPTLIGLVLGICAGIFMPKEYKSSTVILVEEGKSDNPLFNNLAVSTTVGQRLAGIRETILGWNNLTELVKQLKLDADVKSKGEYERLISDLRKNILINLRGSNILNLGFVGRDPLLTQAVVNEISELFIARNVNIQNRETEDAIRFIEDQLLVYKGKIKSSEIAKLQEQLNDLLLDSTENHPHVRELTKKIDALKEELRKENLEFSESVVDKSETNNVIISEIKRALDGLETKGIATTQEQTPDEYYKIMLIEKMNKVMARDNAINTQIYGTLLHRLETAKITQRLQSSKEGTHYSVLEPARVPLSPFKPNKMVVAMLGLVMGLITGVGLVMLVEFLDKSFLDVEEAKNYLGVPLLGAISKINTVQTLRQEKEKEIWTYSLTIVAGVVMIVIATAINNFLQ